LLREYGNKINEFNNLKAEILFHLRSQGLWSLYVEMKKRASIILSKKDKKEKIMEKMLVS